jgi:hypothetical protein
VHDDVGDSVCVEDASVEAEHPDAVRSSRSGSPEPAALFRGVYLGPKPFLDLVGR